MYGRFSCPIPEYSLDCRSKPLNFSQISRWDLGLYTQPQSGFTTVVGQSVAWAAAQGLVGQIKPYLQNKSDGLKGRGLHQGEGEKTAAYLHFLCSAHNHPLGLQSEKKAIQ